MKEFSIEIGLYLEPNTFQKILDRLNIKKINKSITKILLLGNEFYCIPENSKIRISSVIFTSDELPKDLNSKL